jgi:cytochrome c oxidase accessory protein FixG
MSDPQSHHDRQPPPHLRGRSPDLDSVFTVNEDGSRNFLHPADVQGRWQARKNVIFAFLVVFYIALPWALIGGRPAVWIDIPHRSAFLFGLTFTNQDFYLMFFLLSGMGFALFVVTALWGRVWCGFACPQTVWMEGVFRRIERGIEGPREVRVRRNRGPMTGDKFRRKALKHAVFIILSLLLAHAFIVYFLPGRELIHAVGANPAAHVTAFTWVLVMAAVLYFDYAWFREQTCVVLCPYGRLQSALIDADTALIGYDQSRGEPRGKAGEVTGACIDCRRCVVVCPTGIDIRHGLQMECVGCANCIDACDAVMDRLGRARGLVRYDSQRGFDGKRRGFVRPRVFLYAAFGLAGLTVAVTMAPRRRAFEARALRVAGMPYTIEHGVLRNLYMMQIQNKQGMTRTYTIRVRPVSPGNPSPEVTLPLARVVLAPMADTTVPAFATLAAASYEVPIVLTFAVTDSVSGKERAVEVEFLGPQGP